MPDADVEMKPATETKTEEKKEDEKTPKVKYQKYLERRKKVAKPIIIAFATGHKSKYVKIKEDIFTIDIDKEVGPNVVADISDLDQKNSLAFLSDNSADIIFITWYGRYDENGKAIIETSYPYINANRILKTNGTLIIEPNTPSHTNDN